jgi:hypothetical protein
MGKGHTNRGECTGFGATMEGEFWRIFGVED